MPVNYLKDDNGQYVEIPGPLAKQDLLIWQKRGLRQTATGYGKKLTTEWKVFHAGRWYRVYATCHSNVASLYIITKNGKLYIW